MKTKLRPYSGPHAGRLYHVVDSETGAVIRNATPLEVELWEERHALAAHTIQLKSTLQVCADVFRRYEQKLAAKPEPIKAEGHAKIAQQAERAIAATPAADLAEVRARAVDEFIDQWNMEAGGDNDFVRFGYDYTDRLHQEAS